MKRIVSIALTLAMLCMLLTGCVYESFDATVHADGSGTLAMKTGYTEEFWKDMLEDADAEERARLEALTPFEVDGKTYYGTTAEMPFAAPEEFAAAFNKLSDDADAVADDSGAVPENVRLVRDGDGLTLIVDNRAAEPEEDETDETYEAEPYEGDDAEDVTEEDVSVEDYELPDDVELDDAASDDDPVFRISVRFAAPVTQIAGPADGVTIDGGAVTLDLTALANEAYRFTTRTGVALAYDRPLTIELDGKPVELRCYALRYAAGETNYVRVRDLAALLNGTAAQFGVAWADGAVNLTKSASYGEAAEKTPFSGARAYQSENAKTLVDGKDAALDTLALHDEDGGGYTYYKLRDLGAALGFNVRWDAARALVCVESDKPYTG